MYTPQFGERGLAVLVPALAKWLALDPVLVGMLGGPPEQCIIGEGLLTADTPMPCVIISTIAVGNADYGVGVRRTRLICYAVDDGRGMFDIHQINDRLYHLLDRNWEIYDFLQFPPEVGFTVLEVQAPGTTATKTMPDFNGEALGTYVFIMTWRLEQQYALTPPPDPDPDPEPEPEPGQTDYLFSPEELTTDVSNYHRGLEWWRGDDLYVPQGNERTAYQRFRWDQLEDNLGNFTFAGLGSFISGARSRGQRYSFRVQAVVPERVYSCPSNLPGSIVTGVSGTPSGGVFVPDWESPTFISRLNSLLAALKNHLAGHTDRWYIDIGIYGKWAEWHMYGFPTANKASLQAKKNIIDAHVAAFPDDQLLMLTDDGDALAYAMGLNTEKPIGLRRDSWGNGSQFAQFTNQSGWNAAKDRWKTAPFLVEPYASSTFVLDTQAALDQVRNYHITAVANGNMLGGWNDIDAAAQSRWREIQKIAGFRYRVKTCSIDLTNSTVSLVIANSGVAPIYEDTSIRLKIGSAEFALGNSSTLRNLTDEVTVQRSFTGVSAGTHAVTIRIDRNGNPLALAQAGAVSDGWYTLGSIVIE